MPNQKSCPHCGLATIKYGNRDYKVFTLFDWKIRKLARYRCLNCRYQFCMNNKVIGMFDIKVIEQVAFMYLRSVSFQGIVAIMQSWFEKRIFTKKVLIRHIEYLVDTLPSSEAITTWLKPKCSGYYALDGTWMKYRGKDFVLLILFDVKTLDVVGWQVATKETYEAYKKLLKSNYQGIKDGVKGFFCDGDPGLLQALKEYFPGIPIQLCVFHKYARAGQIMPFIRIKNEFDREIKQKVEAVLFAQSKQAATDSLKELKRLARVHSQHEKLKQIVGVLKHNFDLLLTHFDNPEMSPYNNVLEGFNSIVKRKTDLMKGFKKPININRWIKLIMLDWRFHKITSSKFKKRNGKSPLLLADCRLPIIYNWLSFVRKNFPN